MSADPYGYHERSQRADDLLRSMEADFLAVLADHGGNADPKEDGGGTADSPTGTSTDGKATVRVGLSEDAAEYYLDMVLHVRTTGCVSCSSALLGVMEQIIMELIGEGIRNHGWNNEEEEE